MPATSRMPPSVTTPTPPRASMRVVSSSPQIATSRQPAGGEHDDRAGRRRVDGGELVLVRVLEQLVARARRDREGAAGDRRGPPCSGRIACVQRLRPAAEPVEDVGEHRDGQRGEAVDLGIRRGVATARYTL